VACHFSRCVVIQVVGASKVVEAIVKFDYICRFRWIGITLHDAIGAIGVFLVLQVPKRVILICVFHVHQKPSCFGKPIQR